MSTILYIWIIYELISMICEPLCFQLFIPWLNKESDDEVKQMYKSQLKDGNKQKDMQMTLIPSVNDEKAPSETNEPEKSKINFQQSMMANFKEKIADKVDMTKEEIITSEIAKI